MRRYPWRTIAAAALLFSCRSGFGAGFSITGTTVTLSNQTQLTTVGDLQILNGVLNANQSDIVVGGNWTNSGGTFAAGTSTVTFNGAAGQTVNNSGQSFSVLIDSNTSSGGVTFATGLIADSLMVNGAGLAAATTVYFNAGSTFAIGKLSLLGGSPSQRVWIRSTTDTNSWFLNNTGTHTVAYVDVRDSDARSGGTIYALVDSVNSGGNQNWIFNLPPVTPTITDVYISSIAAQWSTVSPSNGYELDASTASDFTGTLGSSITANGNLNHLVVDNLASLSPNTTYFVRVGNLVSGVTDYANTAPASTSTLASPLTNLLIYNVNGSSITVNWTTFGTGPGANTSEGYQLDASTTNFDGTGAVYFSSNSTPATSTLTVTGLTPLTTYYLRAGAFNYNNVLTYVTISSTVTPNGAKTFTSTQSGNFNVGTTWGKACAAGCTQGVDYPGTNDSFFVSNGTIVTVTATPAQAVVDMTVLSGSTLTINGGFTLTSAGNYVNNGTISGAGALTLTGSGTTLDGTGYYPLTGQTTFTNNKTIQATAVLTFPGALAISAGTTLNNGIVSVGGTLNGAGAWTQGANSTLNAGGGTTNAIAVTTVDFTTNPNTVNYNASAIQTCKNTQYYNLTFSGTLVKTCTSMTSPILGNLTIAGSASWTPGAALTVNGIFTLAGGTFTTAGNAFTASSTTEVSGGLLTLGNNTGNKTFVSTVTVDGGILNGASTAIIFQGGLTQTSGSVGITGTATFNTNNQALNGTLSITTLAVSGGITVTNNGTLTDTTATLTGNLINAGTFNPTTLNANGTLTNNGTVTATTVADAGTVLNNGTFTASGNITGAGSWTQGLNSILNAAGTTTSAMAVATVDFASSSNTVNYNRAGTQTCNNTQYYNLTFSGTLVKTCTSMTSPILGNLTIAGSASWTPGAALTVNGIFTLAGGTFTTAGNAFTASSTTEVSGGLLTLGNNTGNKTFVSTVTVDGGILNGASTAIIFQGGLTQTSGSVGITGTATFNTNNQALNGTLSITTLAVSGGITVTNNGTLTDTTATLTGNLINAGTFNPTTLNANGTLTNNGTVTATTVADAGTVLNNGTFTASGNITGAGSWTQGLNSILNAAGTTTSAMAVATVDFASSSNTVNYNRAGTQTCNNTQYYNLTFSGTLAKTCTAMTSPVLGDVLLSGTASWTLGAAIAINGNLSLSAGSTLNTSASSYRVDLGGNLTNGGTFTINSSTLAFTGAAAQTIDNAGQAFWVLIDSNTSGGGVTFASSFTAAGLTVNGAGLASATTVYFNAGSTFTITTLTLQGASGKRVWIRSTNNGTSWFLNNTGSNSVTYVDVEDSDARSGMIIVANDGTSLNSGNNVNWNFGGSGQVRTWWGTVDTNWGNWSNWDSGFPNSQDSVLIVSTASFMPIPTAAVTISSLTINSGSTLTTAGFNFTTNGTVSDSGTLTLTNAVGNKTFNATVTVNNGGVLNTDTGTSIFNDVHVASGGSLQFPSTTGSKTFNGTLTIDGDLNVTANEAVNINGNLVMNGTTSGSNITTFLPAFAAASGGTISGTAGTTSFGSPTFTTAYTNSANLNLTTLTITGTTLTNASTITINTSLAGTGGLTNDVTGTLNLNFTGAPAITTLTATAVGNTVNYNFAGTQTCKNTQYYNLTFSGTLVKTCTAMTSPILGNLTIAGSASWTPGAALTVNGIFTLAGGTFTTAGNAFTASSTTEVSGGLLTLGNNTGNKTFVSTVTVDGGILNGASTAIIFQGGLTQTSGNVGITGTATFNTNDQALNGTLSITTLVVSGGITVTNNGTLTDTTATLTGGLTNSGTFNPTTLNVNGTLTNNGTVTATTVADAGAVLNNGTITASGNITGAGSWTQGTNSILNAGGAAANAMAVATVDFASSSNTVNYNLAGAQTCKNAQYYNLTFSGTLAKTCTAMTSPVLGDVTIGGTASWTLGAAVAVNGNLNLFGGTLDLSVSNFPLIVGGNWTNSGAIFTARASAVTFTGSSGQTIDNAGQAFWVLIDSNTSGGGVTFASSFTAAGLTVNGAGLASATTVYFNAGSTFTITTLTLQGASGKRVWIRSTNNGTSWFLNNTGSNSVTYVDVEDSDARSGMIIVANDGTSLNSGNNVNWNFGGSGQVRTWWGTVDTNWGNWSNWDSGFPNSQDSVLIVSTASFMPIPTAAVTISSLTINSGSTLTTAGFNFTTNGTVSDSGTLTLTNAVGNKTFNATVTVNNGGVLNTDTGTSIFNDVHVASGGSLQFPSTTGSKTFNGTLTIDGDLNVTANEAVNINGNLVMNGTTSGSNITTFLPAFAAASGGTISGTAGTTSFGSPTFTTAYTNSANLNLTTLTITGTTLTNASTITINTSLAGTGGLTNDVTGTLNLNFTGAPAITTLTATAVGNTVNYNFAGTQTCKVTNYYNLGLANSGAKTCALVGGANSVQNITLSGTASWTTSAATTVSGTLALGIGTNVTKSNNAAVSFGSVNSSGTLTVSTTQGSVAFTDLLINDGGLLNFSANETTTISGDLEVDGTGSITSGTGVWTFNKVSGLITGTASSIAITNPTFTTAYTNFANLNLGTLTLTATTLTNDSTITVNTSLTGTGGLTNDVSGTLNIAFTGTPGITTLTATASGNIVNYNFAGTQTCKNTQYYNLQFTNSGAKTCTTMVSPVLGDVTLNGTASWTLGAAVAINGDLNLLGGALDLSANNFPLSVGGNWTNNGGLFTARASTVTFTGTSSQTIDNAGQAFWVLIDSNTSSPGVTFASSFTATRLTINGAGLASATTVYFNAGSTFTVTNLTMTGAVGNMVWIRPTPSGQQWFLNNTSTNTVSYVDVAYSSASAGVVIAAGAHSIDSGNNMNWTFRIISVMLSPQSYDFGTVKVAATTVSTSAITVINDGNDTETYSLSIATTGANTVWTVGTSTPTSFDKFVVEGMFNTVQPSAMSFTSQDVITSTPTTATGGIYAGNQTGAAVPSGESRPLWLNLFMPLTVSTTDQEQINLTVSAGTP